MRTLKRSLCLILALVFVLGLCTVGAGAAALTDFASVTPAYKDAITVMTGLGIIEGFPDGSFKPTDNVTREQATKLVAYMVLGAKNAEKLPAGDGGFTDVKADRWSAKYINFCSHMGFINGMGNGTFAPDGNITGQQLAALLLQVVGFGVKKEYTGSNWNVNAVTDAMAEGIFEDVEDDVNFANYATREETALYFFNTLTKVVQRTYDVDLNRYLKSTGGIMNETLGAEVWNLVSWENDSTNTYQIVENQETGADYTVVRVNGGGTRNFDIETGLDLIAHEVNVYYKNDPKTDADGNRYYPAYLVSDVSTVLNKGFTYADMYKNLVAANKKNADVEIAKVPAWTNYVEDPAYAPSILDYDTFASYKYFKEMKGQASSNDASWLFIGGNYILDHSGEVLCYMRTSNAVGQVTDVADDAIEVNVYDSATKTSSSETFDPKYAYEGIAKKDYVVVQPQGDLTYLKPTTVQEVTITERALGFTGSYSFNNSGFSAGSGYGIYIKGSNSDAAVKVGDKVKFYLQSESAFGNSYFGLEILESGTPDGTVFLNYAFDITTGDGYGGTTKVYRMQTVNEAGKEVVYPVAKKFYNTFTSNGSKTPSQYQGAYQVYLNGDGAISNLVKVTNSDATNVAGKSSYVTNAAGIYYISSDTKVFYIDDTGADMTIKSAKALNTTAGTYKVYINPVSSGSGYSAKTIWVSGIAAPASYGTSYVYTAASKYSYTCDVTGNMLVNGTDTPYYTFYLDGQEVKASLVIDGATQTAGVPIGFYKYSVNSYGQYVLTPASNGFTYVALSNTGTNTIANGKLYTNKVDGKTITNTVIDISGGTTTGTKSDANVNSIERMEELIGQGYTIYISYAYTNSTTYVPAGVIYVVAVTAP